MASLRASTDKLILFGLLILSLVEIFSHYGQVYPDSPGYFKAAHYFQGAGMPAGSYEFRLLRPIIPFSVSLINHLVDIRSSFAVINLLLWCASAILMFYFTKILTKDALASALSAALFTSAIPMLLFGDAALTDMGGYFFILACIYLAVRWDIPRAPTKRVCLLGLILAVGMLTRESVASALIFCLVWTLWSSRSIKRAAILLLIPLAVSLTWSSALGISYLAWYNQGGLIFAAANQPLSPLGRVHRVGSAILYGFGLLPEALLLAALGLLSIRDRSMLKIQVSIWAGAFAIIVAWPVVDQRFTFILFPSIFPLAGMGFEEAFRIIFGSNFAQGRYPNLTDSLRCKVAFALALIVIYVIATNVILRGYVSTPWMPYTDHAVRPSDIV